jgi:hypothetical protein
MVGETAWELLRERPAKEDWRDMCEEKGAWAAEGMRGMDMERSEAGVLSSTAEVEACGCCDWRSWIWDSCWRIMPRRRFWGRG